MAGKNSSTQDFLTQRELGARSNYRYLTLAILSPVLLILAWDMAVRFAIVDSPALAATIHYLSSILGHRLQRVQWLRDSHTRWYESISRRRGFRCCDYCWNRLWVVERRLSRRQCRIARSSRDHSPHSAASVYSVVHSLVRNWGAFKNTPDILLRDADCDVEHGGGCTQRSYRQNTRGTIAWCELSSNIRFRCHAGGTSTYHGGSASCCRCGVFHSGGIRAIGRRFRTRFCYHRREHLLSHA